MTQPPNGLHSASVARLSNTGTTPRSAFPAIHSNPAAHLPATTRAARRGIEPLWVIDSGPSRKTLSNLELSLLAFCPVHEIQPNRLPALPIFLPQIPLQD